MRKKRPLVRNTDIVRDTRLVVIASEDKYAVRQYFELFRSRRIQFKCLETLDGSSAPAHVFERLLQYMDEFEIGPDDQLWFVSDTDHWAEPNHIQNFMAVVRHCRDKGIRVAISNPCFELWLLLHFADASANEMSCNEIAAEIRKLIGVYNKGRIYDLPIDNDAVEQAINRSKSSQTDLGELPGPVETRVHLVIEELVKLKIISID